MSLFTRILIIPNSLLTLRLIRFFLRRKKVLICLLRLEFILLNLFFIIILTLRYIRQPLSHSIFILVLGACEARLGLRLVINITRFKGNDMLTKKYFKF